MLKVFSTMEGIEIVGKLEKETEQGFEIKSAIAIVPHLNEKGDFQGLQVRPVALFASADGTDIWLSRAMVKMFCDAPSQLESEYIKATSGIEVTSRMPT